MRLIPVILCGGAGSRLWPLSRELYPKPFLMLIEGKSLLQKTFERASALMNVSEILTITNQELLFQSQDQLAQVNTRSLATQYILEPFGRNTAPAIAAASIYISKTYGNDSTMLVLPADHLIRDEAAFAKAVEAAVTFAGSGKLVTFGITPEGPETGYGYIEAKGNKVIRFVEKPSLAEAQRYFQSGHYLWNSGMFCFTAATMLTEMRRHCPDILDNASDCLAQAVPVNKAPTTAVRLPAERFAAAPDISIDYAVMEKSTEVVVVPCTIGWNDIGSLDALAELSVADNAGNRIHGQALLQDAEGCYIHSDTRVVGAVGVKDLMIIDTPDALLVTHRGKTQNVKQLYATLKARGDETHKQHRTVHRPWGTYTVLEEGPGFKIKRIVVKPQASLSLQMHKHRSEHWVVVGGTARVVNGERELDLHINESTYIAAGNKHRLINLGKEPLVMIEVQSGQYLGEDDIIRLEDNYGRIA